MILIKNHNDVKINYISNIKLIIFKKKVIRLFFFFLKKYSIEFNNIFIYDTFVKKLEVPTIRGIRGPKGHFSKIKIFQFHFSISFFFSLNKTFSFFFIYSVLSFFLLFFSFKSIKESLIKLFLYFKMNNFKNFTNCSLTGEELMCLNFFYLTSLNTSTIKNLKIKNIFFKKYLFIKFNFFLNLN